MRVCVCVRACVHAHVHVHVRASRIYVSKNYNKAQDGKLV